MNKILLYFLVLFPTLLFAQFNEQQNITWPDKYADYKELPDSLKNNDAVILNENLTITQTHVETRVAIKILNEKGLEHFKNLQLPQNFDLTNSPNFNKQGRFKNRINPFALCTLNYFIARIIKPNKKIIELPLKYKTGKVFWIKNNGEHLDDKVYDFDFENLQVGDVLEYIYKISISGGSFQEVVYPNGRYPKLNYNLEIIAKSQFYEQYPKNLPLLYNTNIDSANFKFTDKIQSNERVVINSYHYNYLKGINYPQNFQLGTLLPNISINNVFSFNPNNSYSRSKGFFSDPYKWVKSPINIHHKSIHDAYHEKIRKFLKTIETNEQDTFNVLFLSKLLNTLNDLKYVSAESVNYSGEAQYAANSAERLLEGKIFEEFMTKDYSDLLAEKNIFFYQGMIIDKRLSAINIHYRNHDFLKKEIFVLPFKKDYKYFKPRNKGLKYFLDELPFYFEGTVCALMPCYDCVEKNNVDNLFFVRTPLSTVNENSRKEIGVFSINVDSLIINATIKEHLSGQFSTVLRPFYNKEAIDSTIPEHYFKKCIDKPLSFNAQIKHPFSEDVFPFTQKYHCSEKINMSSKTKIDLHNWFSFTYKKEEYSKQPNHDFYTDFLFTDSYDFLFQFNKPVEIINLEKLQKTIENNYFEIISSLTKQDGNNYLLNLRVKVKQSVIPEKDGDKLMEFINALDEINNFEIELKK